MRRATSTPPDLPGYNFVRLLGSGGFSDVFLYDQLLPRRRVAVKVLITEDLTQADRAAFVAEANLMAQLSAHPYIVSIFHADVAGDRPFFVMEYCSGPSLADRYKQAPFAVADAVRTGVRLSSAVATAHAAGILHRDIKPANVLSNDYGWPALTDFGISSALDDEVLPVHTSTFTRGGAVASETGTTGTGQSIGLSVPWSPPEMFEDDPDPDVRSDVFSLAATIWTILAGQTPFEVRGRSNGTLDLIGRIERGAITPMNRDDVPRQLIAVLQKGMSTDRNDRFATAVDFARALQRVELELGYAQTDIEVPNMRLDAPERPSAGSEDDETRARSVATIDAQPIAPVVVRPPASPPPVVPVPESTPAIDETQLRGAPVVVSQPAFGQPGRIPIGVPVDDGLDAATVIRRAPAQQTATEVLEPESEAPPRSRRSAVVGVVVGAIALLVVAAVVIGIVLFGGVAQGGDPDPTPSGSGEAIVPEIIPVPALVGAAVDNGDGTASFTVSNPDPEDGDSFIWNLRGTADDESRHRAPAEVITAPLTAGTSVCVDIAILRGTKTGNPLTTCYPAQ